MARWRERCVAPRSHLEIPLKTHAALLLLVTLRGNIFLYQGEELGLPQAQLAFPDLKDPEAITNWPLSLGRDGARTPMPWVAQAAHAGFSSGRPWLPVPEAHLALAVDRQESEPHSQLSRARRLIALRNRLPGLRIGDMRIVEAGTEVLLFERTHGTEELLCAFNFGRHAHTLPDPPPGRWRVLEAVGGASAWTLPPWSGLIAQRLGLA